MNKQQAEMIVSSWNGKDSHFIAEDGNLYHEDDVQEAIDYLELK